MIPRSVEDEDKTDIWNEVVWNQKGIESSSVVVSASLYFNQGKSAQDKSFDNYLGFMTLADGKEHWECPNKGTVKINTNAALFEDSSRYSVSMVARNHSGELVEAISRCRQGDIDPELAEAIEVHETLSWVKNKGWSAVDMETDCLALAQFV
ncbi:hypothetical protein AgCh_016347 [Apium graveolens]